jgi:hypothetical protein
MSNLPMKTATVNLEGQPKYLQPAPVLQKALPGDAGVCSDCGQAPIFCGDGDLAVCPKCYGLLWHKDYGELQQQLRREREEATRIMVAARAKAAKEAAWAARAARAKQGSHQIVVDQEATTEAATKSP